MSGRLRHALAEDSGVAIITVVGVIAVITVIAIMAFTVSQQALLDSTTVYSQTLAFQAANSGIDVALARMQAHGFNPADYPLSGTIDGASYVASVSPAANSNYLCQSVGTDERGSVETVTVSFFYLNIWQMNLAAGSDNALGGGSVKGTTSVKGPFYVRGGATFGSNSYIHDGPLFLNGGSLTLSGSGEVGQSSRLIDLYVTGAHPNMGDKNFYARSVSNAVPEISLPIVDNNFMNTAYNQAKAESVDNKQGYADTTSTVTNLESKVTSAATQDPTTYPTYFDGWTRPRAPGAATCYKVIGADGGIATLRGGTHPLTIGGTGSWGSYSGDGHYTLTSHDDFAFDDTTNILYVEGTVFVDGPLTLAEDVYFVGNGQLIVNGDITVNGKFIASGTTKGYMDAYHSVGLVTPGNITVNTNDANVKDSTADPTITGALFASKDFSMTSNGLLVRGSVIAGSISFNHPNQHLVTDPDLPNFLPRGMPGNGQCILTKGSWVRQ